MHFFWILVSAVVVEKVPSSDLELGLVNVYLDYIFID